MYVDLHAHTTASDGSLEPEELVNLGKSIGLKAMAVTDHDTIAGVARALAQGEKVGLEVIAGVEISSDMDDCDVHLLGLFLDPHNEDFLHRLAAMGVARAKRNVEMVDKLQEAGININREDLPSADGGKQIARGHIAQILIERGYATHLREALDNYLVKGTVGYVKKAVLSVAECIDLVHKAGGLIFVAHLHQIDPQNPAHCLAIAEKILAMGADGIETIYSEYNDHWAETTEALAQRMGVLRTGGSDFHGEMKQHLSLGTGYGHLKVPYEFVEAMKEKLDKK
jgi:hypothetical protein